jgi:ATP-binding cassette, subfamily B, bacterial
LLSGFSAVRNQLTGKCLAVAAAGSGAVPGRGAAIVQWDCNGFNDKAWFFGESPACNGATNWQKLAIARPFYQSAPVLILDEPTSAIDSEAELEIFNNLEAEYCGKTLILVSHRFSTVRNADHILVIEEGRVVESGSHDELLAASRRYASMFGAQAAGYR